MKTLAFSFAKCQAPLQRRVAHIHRRSGARPHVAATSSSHTSRGTCTGAVSVSHANVSTPAYVAEKEGKKPNQQIITVAVDGSENSVQGLKWLLDSFSGTGSTVHVVHVVNDDRVSNVSIGSSGIAGSSVTGSFDEHHADHEAYLERKVSAAQYVLSDKYLQHLDNADIKFTVNVHVVDGQRSAAGIAAQVVQAATLSGSDLLAVTSQGGGLHCAFGSVARYCAQHFPGAVLLLPPNLDFFPHRGSKTVCVGVNTLSELQDSMTWAARKLCNSGDSISVLRAAEETMTGQAAGSDQMSIMLGLQEQIDKHHINNISFDLIQPNFESALASSDLIEEAVSMHNQVTADEILNVAATKGARALVMTNYAAKGFMQEMMFGTLSLLASRKAPLPLLLIPPGSFYE